MATIKRTRITENIYTAVKLILRGGAKYAEAADAMGISLNSVQRINKSDSYEDYVNFAYMNGSARYRDQEKKEKEERQEKPQEKQEAKFVTVPWQVTQEMRKTNELLESISRKLAFIVDELTTTPCKEGKDNA